MYLFILTPGGIVVAVLSARSRVVHCCFLVQMFNETSDSVFSCYLLSQPPAVLGSFFIPHYSSIACIHHGNAPYLSFPANLRKPFSKLITFRNLASGFY